MADIHPLATHFPLARKKLRKPPEFIRDQRVVLLINQDERRRLEAIARERQTSISGILRAAIQVIPPTRLHLDAIRSINRLGTNLNTLIRALYSDIPCHQDLLQAIKELQDLHLSILAELRR